MGNKLCRATDAMNAHPAISVVLPTYNRANYLPVAMRSVLCQTMAGFELIVVDDGSTDRTEEVIRSIRDPRVRYVRQSNKGACAARNVGIGLARGEFVAFQDSSDQWALDKLEKQFALLAQSPCHVVAVYSSYMGYLRGRAVVHPGPHVKFRSGKLLDELLKGNFIDTPTLLARKNALDTVGGFDESLPRFQDWDLVIRLASIGEFAFIERPLLFACDAPNSITVNKPAGIQARQIIYDKYQDLFLNNPRLLSSHLYKLGLGYLEADDLSNAKRVFLRAWHLNKKDGRLAMAYVFGREWLRFTKRRLF